MGTRPRCADAFRLQLDAWPAKKKGQVLLAPYREVPGKVPEAERGEVEGRGVGLSELYSSGMQQDPFIIRSL